MRSDYKFWYVLQNDEGVIEEVAVRWYEGDYDGEGIYRRSRRLSDSDLAHLASRDTKAEQSGAAAIVYGPKHFGRTTDLDVVRAYLKAELAKDATREPVAEQVVTAEDQATIDAIESTAEDA